MATSTAWKGVTGWGCTAVVIDAAAGLAVLASFSCDVDK
jgi:hypothetical protein